MDEEFKDILKDPKINDSVKVALLPEILKADNFRKSPNIPSWRKIIQSGPIIAALASIFTVGITEFSKGNLASADKEHERSLEQQKFQFGIIRLALDESKSPEDRASSLRFFTEIKLLQGLDSLALTKWSEADDIPSISSENESPFMMKRRLYAETIGILHQFLKQSGDIDPESKIYRRFWELYNRELIGVESKEVAEAMIKFGDVLRSTKTETGNNRDNLLNLGIIVINLMRSELEFKSEVATIRIRG